MRRSGFFLTLQKELHVHGGRPLRGLERIERGQHGDDRPLVVTGRAGTDTHGGIDGVALGRHGHGVGGHAVFVATQLGRERIAVPSATGHRLSVVVRVHHDRARSPGRFQLTKKCGISTGRRAQQTHDHTAFGERRREKLDVATNVRGVGGHVGNGHQRERLVEDFAFVGAAPGVDRGAKRLGRQRGGDYRSEGDHGKRGRDESTTKRGHPESWDWNGIRATRPPTAPRVPVC